MVELHGTEAAANAVLTASRTPSAALPAAIAASPMTMQQPAQANGRR